MIFITSLALLRPSSPSLAVLVQFGLAYFGDQVY